MNYKCAGYLFILIFFMNPLLGRPLVVATKEAAPFAYKNENGTWKGISVELWDKIAGTIGVDYEIREYDLAGLFSSVQEGRADIALGAITITEKREKLMDFSHPFFVTGLGIAVPVQSDSKWMSLALNFFSYEFIEVMLLLLLVLGIAGTSVWLVERKNQTDCFPDDAKRGIFEGLWWAAVTMTTVGYGDRSPKSNLGKIIAIVWMFTSVIIISSFTASIASSLTVSKLGISVSDIHDLKKVRTGSIAGSTSENLLQANNISFRNYKTPVQGLEAVANGSLDAFVYDVAILKHEILKRNLGHKIKMLPKEFDTQYYGIGLAENNALREKINRILLAETKTRDWQQKLAGYLGND